MKIYTKTGDTGKTSLIGGLRVDKDDLRVIAYGTVDELTAVMAFLRDNMGQAANMENYREDILHVLTILMNIEAVLASGGTSAKNIPEVADNDISYLEGRIDYINLGLKPVDKFTMPGGHPLVSLCHLCRTVCRRAERTAVSVSHEFEVPENVIIYLNRLSDYLYQLGRKLAEETGAEELYWTPGN